MFAARAVDGWTLALDELERSPDAFLDRLSRLGEVTGALHRTLGSERSDPGFRPEVIAPGSLDLLAETVSAEIEELFGGKQGGPLPDFASPIEAGKAIRDHGDYHLGQVLWSNGDWLVVDFEGEPARQIAERSEKHSPLRDVAGMLRSFAYAASAASILRGVEAPPDWEDRARARFLAGYLATVDSDLLPSGEAEITGLLRLFELERALYELRYERNHRPDWVTVAEAGIGRLLS